MIRKIVKDSDIKFSVSEDSKIQDKFIIKFYTVSKSTVITKTAENVIEEEGKRYIKLNWSELRHLENGMINYEVNNLDSDADYNDGVYNSTFTRTTYYYLYTDTNSGGGGGAGTEEIEQKIDQIITDLDKEKEDRAQGDTQLTEKTDSLEGQIGGNYTWIQSNKSKITAVEEKLSEYDKLNLSDKISDYDSRIFSVEHSIEDIEYRFPYDSSNEKIQNSLSALGDRVSPLEMDVSNLKTDVSSLKTDVSNLKTDVSSLSGRVSPLETNVTQNQENITDLQTSNTDLKKRMSLAETEIKNLKDDVGNLKINVPPDLSSTMETIETNISVLQSDVSNLEDRIRALESK